MDNVCQECKYEKDQGGASVNLSLILSAVTGHSKCTRSLLEEGADVNYVVTQNDIRYEYRFIDRQRARRKPDENPKFFVLIGSRALFEAAYRGNSECPVTDPGFPQGGGREPSKGGGGVNTQFCQILPKTA